jgi:hypothetical protein
LVDERRGSDRPRDRQRELDAKVEQLAHQIAEVVNNAGDENRQDLREYAIGLLRDETERAEVPPPSSELSRANRFSPLAFAGLLVLVSLPLFLSVVFAPVGLGVLAVAALMGTWGLIQVLFRRDR